MDGASKFVRGDAIAGIIITLINIVGGLDHRRGRVRHAASAEAAEVFTQLTIGDGLVSQVPAFLISLAAGLLVTRSTQKSNLPREFLQQLFSRPQALAVTGGFLGILVFTSLPRDAAAGARRRVASALARMMTAARSAASERRPQQGRGRQEAKPPEERVEDYLTVDPMEIELGVGLIRLADPNRGGDLLDRVQRVRQNVAGEIGIIMPKVRIRDNMRLDANAVSHQDRRHAGRRRASRADAAAGDRLGHDDRQDRRHRRRKDPAFGTDAKWIDPALRGRRPRCTATRSSSRARCWRRI